MAKGKHVDRQPHPPPPQRAILSRLSFLYQAASLLSLPQQQPPAASPNSDSQQPTASQLPVGLSRYYTSNLLAVSKKSVQRLSPTVKHTLCKRCSSVLTPGISCTTRVENLSKNGRKKWADVLVIECNFCKACKRFQMNERGKKKKDVPAGSGPDVVQENVSDGTAAVTVDVPSPEGDSIMTGT
ncbi:hypothetical protein ABW20_dc0110407 [Dactylellina cionopaga]|nr:hypothetical protein ABW20_dc0110407 [Dactylellina cionopaga]